VDRQPAEEATHVPEPATSASCQQVGTPPIAAIPQPKPSHQQVAGKLKSTPPPPSRREEKNMEERIEITRKYLAKRENLQLHLFLSCIALLVCLSGLTLLYCYSKGKELFDTMHMETVGVVSVGLVIAFIVPFCLGAALKTGARYREIMTGRVKVDKLNVTEVEDLENDRFRITLRADTDEAIPYAVYGTASTIEDICAGEKAYVIYVGSGSHAVKPALICNIANFFVPENTRYL
jgi:hypothetical protein